MVRNRNKNLQSDITCSHCNTLQQSTTNSNPESPLNMDKIQVTSGPKTGCCNHGLISSATKIWQIVLLLTVLLVLVDKGFSLDTENVPVLTQFQDLRQFQDLSRSKYYRYFTIDADGQRLYVGSKDYLYRLNLNDISQVDRRLHLPADDTSVRRCSAGRVTPAYYCTNHIRSVIVTGDEVQVCGTGADAPRVQVLNKADLSTKNANVNNQYICAPDPDANTTAIYITNGNPGNIGSTYSGGPGLVQNQDAVYRPQIQDTRGQTLSSFLRTVYNDDKFLYEDPQFVGSFDVGSYVYFFFREPAIEYENCGKAVYSRIARVCKNDLGGTGNLEYLFTTFLKARLNCSVSGEFPLYFDTIYDIKRIGDTFYGTFTTNNGDFLSGSAVCAFSEADIETAFSGTFKDQKSLSSLWLDVPEDEIPRQRPGECVNNSLQLSGGTQQFVRHHPIMSEAVAHKTSAPGGAPLYYQSQVLYNRLAVDVVTVNGDQYHVYFLATAQGHIHKVVQWNEQGLEKNRLISIWKAFGEEPVTIWKIEIHNDRLYVATDDSVRQLPVAQCEMYEACSDCAHDPHCGWHRADRRCTLRSSQARNNVKGDVPTDVCNSNTCQLQSSAVVHNVRIPGDPIYLHCTSHCTTDTVQWYMDSQALDIDHVKYFLAKDNGLLIFNITAADSAVYSCTDARSNVELASHELVMPDCGDDKMCLWQEEFRNWCSEFDSYKKQFNNWVCLKDACVNEQSCMPQAVSQICPLSP